MSLENVDEIFPLAPMQALMLMHSIRVKGSSTLANQFLYRLRGKLDRGRFSHQWQRACDRHPALRTVFIYEDVEQPLQVVRSKVKLEMAFVDLSALSVTERDLRVEALLQSDRKHGFDLLRAPLMRTTLARLGPDEHLLIWSRHHLILDLWSVEILFDEIFKCYDQPQSEPEAGASFQDYVAWISQQAPDAVKRHWCDYLDGFRSPSLAFTHRARRSAWSGQGQPVIRRSLNAALSERLRKAARTNGLTIGTLLQGTLALLLATRLRRDDVVFGLTVSGRPQDLPNVERILGSFINNVPVRIQIDAGQALTDWLQNIQMEQARRAPFEFASLTDIQRWSELPPEAPLFDVLLLLHSPVASAPASKAIDIEPIDGPFDSALPFTLAVAPAAKQIELTAVYDTAVVEPAAATEFVDALCTLLERLSHGVSRPLSSMLPEGWTIREAPVIDRPANTGGKTSDAVGVGFSARHANEGNEAADVAAVLLDIWRETLGMSDIGLDDDFFALGGTSVQAAIAFVEIEQRLGRVMPLSVLFEAGSVRKLIAALKLPPPPPSSLVSIQRFGPRPPVLAVSGIGGNVVGLANIARALGEMQPFFGLQSKAFAGEDTPAVDVEAIAADFIHESTSVMRAEYVLLGICFGANVVLEMAQQLSRAGNPPSMLVVLDPVYDDQDIRASASPLAGSAGSANVLMELVRDRTRDYVDAFLKPNAAGRWTFLLAKGTAVLGKLRHRNLFYGNEVELRQRRVRAANLQAARSYVPQSYSGETRVLLTDERAISAQDDPRLKWIRNLVPGAQVARIPGKDTGVALGQHSAVLADQLRSWIAEIDPDLSAAESTPAQGAAVTNKDGERQF